MAGKGYVDAKLFEGRRSTIGRDVQYVASQIRIKDPRPEDAPSAAAWAFLSWVRESSAHESEFWRSIWPRLFPRAGLAEEQERFADDGADVVAIIEQLMAGTDKPGQESGT